MRCEELRELAPELALGIADGEQRAEALRHLAACQACRRAVAELAGLADDLLSLTPGREPPLGFESRVIARLKPGRLPRAPRRALRVLAAGVAGAALTAAGLLAAFEDERDLASRYRETLERAGGEYFDAYSLRDRDGAEAGLVFGYQGPGSWILVAVERGQRSAVDRAEVLTADGRRLPLRAFRLQPGTGTWGGAIPVDLREVATVRLLGERRGEILEAELADE